ncbi:MAG: S8 family serine peptidase [Thermoplasmata archaeon]|nr:S8 family serine peptidase [Thermoplasmata archaeon]
MESRRIFSVGLALMIAGAMIIIFPAAPGGAAQSDAAANEAATSSTIYVGGYTFDINHGEPAMPPNLIAKEPASGEQGLYIVHCIGPIMQEWADGITNLGGEIITYVADNSYEVKMTPEQADSILLADYVDWVGLYHPAYKVSQDIIGSEVIVTLNNRGSKLASADSFGKYFVSGMGSETSDGYIFKGKLANSGYIDDLAADPDVQFIEQYNPEELHDEMGMQITGGFAWVNDPDSNINTPYRTLGTHGSYANQLGWDGSGVTIGIADSGGGDGSTPNMGHNDFTGRVIGGIDLGATVNGWNDQHGHGTHCAGLMAGDTFEGNGLIYAGAAKYYVAMGQAHESQVYVEQIFEGTSASFDAPADYGDILRAGYTGGARVHSNSWGSETDGAYAAADQAYDTCVRDASTAAGNQQLVVVCSAGNAGPSTGSIGSPGNGKNVITVGSFYNYMPDATSYGYSSSNVNNPDTVSSFSSRGWSDSNRIKPDVVAPGEATLSTKSPQATAALFGTYTVDNRYQWCSGTSQACPTVTGGAAVIYEWYQATYGAAPSPAMVKALLINSAVDTGTKDIPNQNEGWGRMYLPTIVSPPVNVINRDSQPELTTGTYSEIQFSYANSGQPLKITLAYTDKNAVAGAAVHLINNLDLRLTSPTGLIYHGNAFATGVTPAGTNPNVLFDTNSDGWDDRNNVECIYLPTTSLESGLYTLRVTGFNVPGDCDNDGSNDQDYSLVIYNAAQDTTATATGPIGTSNSAAVTITYTKVMTPASVNLYYTKSTSSPYTWVLAGNDATVDGSYSYTITAGSGTYGWLASAVGGTPVSVEPSPPGNTVPPEATSYILDITAPAAPTGLTVQHWGSLGENNAYTQLRYMRGVPGEADFNGLSCYLLGLTESTTEGNWAVGVNSAVYLGMRVFKRNTAGTETEITTALSATVSRTSTGSGYQTATWAAPQTVLATTDSLVVKVYGGTAANPTTVRATFTTEPLGATQLDAATWTVQYWTRYAGAGGGGSDWYWGTSSYSNTISNFKYSTLIINNPLDDNTLNWTASTSPDADHYNVYRSDLQTGTYTLIGSTPVGTNTYCDVAKGQADTTRWWYRVRTVDAATNEETNTNAVQEPGTTVTPPYAISLTGKAANSWVFVSFPSGVSGTIQTVLNDAAAGDGLTTWSVAKWYNPATPADPWKSYRVGGTANDMPTLTNTMGVWLWITANGGDQALTLSSYVAIPASTNINLAVGWNLVGYPSMTDRLGSTLPAAVDMLSVYSTSATYTDYVNAAIDPVTLHHGNAYFMHATAAAVWTVTNP